MRYRTALLSRTIREIGLLLLVLTLSLPFVPSPSYAVQDKEAPDILSKFQDALSSVAEKVKPAVVNVSTTRVIKTPRHPFFDDPAFRKFFPPDFMPPKRKAATLGSGVIATPDGIILTNNHVVEGAEDIVVKLSDNREFKAKVVGTDSRSDIAVLKIDEKNLPTVPWGDSGKMKVGDLVLAIGNPFALNQTITMGIISALGRTGIGITDYEDFIQTDAAINPGNSGGALVNIRGELIGINTAIFSTTGGYQGIGFAISSNMAHYVMNSIMSQGRVVRGWLGVQIQQLTPELAKQFNMKEDTGVLVVDVTEGSPAEKAGLQRGDVIVEFNGKKVEDPSQLRNQVAAVKPGTTVNMKVSRNGSIITKQVVLGELPSEIQEAQAQPGMEGALRGVYVQNLDQEIIEQFEIPKRVAGVIVTKIEDDSPAAGKLMPGDIIMEVNRKPVPTTKQYAVVAKSIPKGKDVLLLVMRRGVTQFVTIPSQ